MCLVFGFFCQNRANRLWFARCDECIGIFVICTILIFVLFVLDRTNDTDRAKFNRNNPNPPRALRTYDFGSD